MLFYRFYICNGSRNIWIDKHEQRRINILKNRYYSKYHYWTKLKSSAFKLRIAHDVVAILVSREIKWSNLSNFEIRGDFLGSYAEIHQLAMRANRNAAQIVCIYISKAIDDTLQKLSWTLEISQLSLTHDLFFNGLIVLNFAKDSMKNFDAL